MQVEAIYNQGSIQLVQPLRFKRDHVRLVISVPDEDIEPQAAAFTLSAEAMAQAQAMLDQYESILNAPVPNDDALPELSAEYAERLQAIDMRAQIRQEQGRPV